ncbi:hypothetical protein Hanom_Chr03g00193751 [Helianthus anomalus]
MYVCMYVCMYIYTSASVLVMKISFFLHMIYYYSEHNNNKVSGHCVKVGPYLGGATRVVMQPWRSPTQFVRFHICRSEPKTHTKFYFHSVTSCNLLTKQKIQSK